MVENRKKKNSLYFNSMSCFECNEQCVHDYKTKKIYDEDINEDDAEPCSTNEVSTNSEDVNN